MQNQQNTYLYYDISKMCQWDWNVFKFIRKLLQGFKFKNKISTNEELKEIYATQYATRLNEVGESDKISISEYKIRLSELKTQIQSLKEEAKFTLNNIYQITAVAIDDLKFLSEFNTEEISKNLNFLDFEDTYISQKLQAELI